MREYARWNDMKTATFLGYLQQRGASSSFRLFHIATCLLRDASEEGLIDASDPTLPAPQPSGARNAFEAVSQWRRLAARPPQKRGKAPAIVGKGRSKKKMRRCVALCILGLIWYSRDRVVSLRRLPKQARKNSGLWQADASMS